MVFIVIAWWEFPNSSLTANCVFWRQCMLVAMMNHIFAVYPSDQIGLLTLWLSDANAQLITKFVFFFFLAMKNVCVIPFCLFLYCAGCVGLHKMQDLRAGFFQRKVPLVQGVQVTESTGKHCIGWKNKRRGPCIPKTNSHSQTQEHALTVTGAWSYKLVMKC